MSNPTWKQVTLAEICSFKYGKMPKKSERTESGYPMFSGYGIVGFADKYLYEQPEVIVVARGVGGTGDVKMSPPKCFLTNLSIAAQIKSPEVDKLFLYYRLQFPSLWELRTGSAQAQITINHLERYETEIPPLPTQRKIASILSAYDDLIENNTRRIAILEEMAQAIYREWFVNFRFPGHEDVKLVDSPLGQIPEGWEVTMLGDVMSATRGLSYKGKHRNPDGIPMHNLNSVLEGGGYKYAGIKFYDGPYKPKHVVDAGDLIVANTEQGFDRRLIGHAALIPRAFKGDGIASHHLYIVKPLETSYLSRIFFLHLLNDEHFHWGVSGFANGTTINMLPVDALTFPKFPMPPERLVDEFTEFAMQILEQKEVLYRKNGNLRSTCDLLLPKLISGKLDVEDLDIEVGIEIEPLEELNA